MRGALIRRARRPDAISFFRLIIALAEFEGLEPPDDAAQLRLMRDIFEYKRLGVFLATVDGMAVGYALYFYTYSSFLGRPTLYLEDIFVLGEHRRRGIGRSLFLRCAEEARVKGCGRMEWAVLKWNSGAIGFYEREGAKRLSGWHYYRLDSSQIERLAGSEDKERKERSTRGGELR
jgi:GNAT superfamily N-acetyltransferase